MPRKLVLAAAIMACCQLAWAETCPSIAAIKSNHLAGWKAYDSDDGVPLSSKREIQFKNNAREFALAEWTNSSKKSGSIHCYYRDNTGSDLEAYLAKDNFAPENSRDYWYQVSGSMHCAAGMDKCKFLDSSNQIAQLAKR